MTEPRDFHTHTNESENWGTRALRWLYGRFKYLECDAIQDNTGANSSTPAQIADAVARSAVWRNGTGVPDNGLGLNGDYYLDDAEDSGDVYKKSAGTYSIVANILGPAGSNGTNGTNGSNGAPGADGKTILSGSGAPGAGLGVNGDFYIDTTADDVYGPKAGGAWGAATSMIGPQGPAGAGGETGPAGPAPGSTGTMFVQVANGVLVNPATVGFGSTPGTVADGGHTHAQLHDAATAGTGIGVSGQQISLQNTACTAGTYTISTVTVDAQGRITFIADGSAVASVSGTAPIASSGGSTPAISISAATTGAAGSMSAADKLKLDGLSLDGWIPLTAVTDFATTGASTSTITMNSDQTSNISVGYMLKYTYDGVVYRGMCTAIAANLLTIAGAPIATGAGLLTALSYKKKAVEPVWFFISGPFADAANTTLYNSDMYAPTGGPIYRGPTRYVVKWTASCFSDDTGAAQPIVDLMVNAAHVCTSNGNTGLAISDASWVETVVDINAANYDINDGEKFELATDASGTNDDATNLTLFAYLCDA